MPANRARERRRRETDDGRQCKPARTVADRRRGRAREIDRPAHRHHRHGGCDREGCALALRQRNRSSRRDRSEDRRAAPCAAHAGGRGGGKSRQPDQPGRCAQAPSGCATRRHHRRHAAAARIRAHRGAVGQAGDRAEGARGRARPSVRGIQGPHQRHRQRHRQACRIRQRGGRSRPRRSDRAARRDAAARDHAQRRPHPRLHLRRAPRSARAADLPLAHASAVHGEAVRAGGSRDLRRHRRGEGGGTRSGLARQDRGDLARFLRSIRSAPASACAARACRPW